MKEATITSRMPAEKKSEVQKILKKNGTNPSRIINAAFDRIIEDGDISFLIKEVDEKQALKKENLLRAIEFIDSIPIERKSKFDDMTKDEIKMLRLKDRGLL